MTGLGALIKRNTKLYFKDKGLFFSSLITPLILLVLYTTFLKKVYDDSFRSALRAAGTTVSDAVINGCVGGQLMSSLLAVTCVTVAFCSNLLMIRDKTGGALSSCVNFFLSTDGQASAVGTIVSAGYGFICGAYMPISNFGKGLRNVLSFLPDTYGKSLLRNHAMRGVLAEMRSQGFPDAVVESIRDSVDCNLAFFGKDVTIGAMYAVLTGSILLFIGVYIAMNIVKSRRR